jgi:hypothetical protein
MSTAIGDRNTHTGLQTKSAPKPGRAIRFWHWLEEEAVKMWPVFVFFLAGFLLVLIIIKLALAQYSIEMNALSQALIGALMAAKVVLILENTPFAHPFRRSARILSISCKSLVYGAAVILLAYLERVIDTFRHRGHLVLSMETVFENSKFHRLFALSIGIALVFGVYFAFSDLNEFVGKGALRGFFLNRREPAS